MINIIIPVGAGNSKKTTMSKQPTTKQKAESATESAIGIGLKNKYVSQNFQLFKIIIGSLITNKYRL